MGRKIDLTELFEAEMLHLPHESAVRTVKALKKGHRFTAVGGIYIFYTQHREVLYVGISDNVASRTVQHSRPKRGNKDLYRHLQQHKGCYVRVYYEDSRAYRETYESYLINILQPRYNVAKTDRERV